MFHCNGWCFPWTLAANAGASVCLRQVRDDAFIKPWVNTVTLLRRPSGIEYLLAASDELKALVQHQVKVMTAGKPPPAAIIQGMQAQGIT